PLLRVGWYELGPAQGARVLVAAHHLVIDGVGWRILVGDLETAYTQARSGAAIALPPKTTDVQRWAEQLVAYAQRDTLRAEAAYWLSPERARIAPLPVDSAVGSNTVADVQTLTAALSVAETHALLHAAPAIYQTDMHSLLLAALAYVLADWSGSRALLIDVETHGRETIFEDLDLSRTVGWFTALFPLLLDLDRADTLVQAVASVKAQIEAIPGRGVGYGLLRYLSQDADVAARLRELPQPQISFNYLGQLDAALSQSALFAPAQESAGPTHSPQERRAHLLEINGQISGDHLRLTWIYNPHAHRTATIERLAQATLAALRALLSEHPPLPAPIDVSLVNLDQPTRERLREQLGAIEDLYPVTSLQQHMLDQRRNAPRPGLYVIHQTFAWSGPLHIDAFRQAWQAAVDRHPVLRTTFVWEHLPQPLQVVHAHAQVPVTLYDWRNAAPAEQRARLAALVEAIRHAGFALDQPPQMRVDLIQVADERFQCVWSVSYMLVDGWSLPLITKDVFVLYEAFVEQHTPPAADAPRYREYMAWLQQQDLREAELFWRKMFDDRPELTPLVDRIGAARPDAPPAYLSQRRRVPQSTSAALQSLGRQHGLTLSTIVQGAWAVLLSRYTSRQDVIFGVTVSGRPPALAGVERMVGLFINMLPVRVRLDPAIDRLAWLRQLQLQQVELRQYEHTPLAKIYEWCDLDQRQPLFESYIVFENFPVDETLAEHMTRWRIGGEVDALAQTEHPLRIEVVPGETLQVTMCYDQQCCSSAAITAMLDDLVAVLTGLAEDLANDAMR
ncbi:MAG TPA: condensation domain-containing protein, partial [Herpetosiphonaceae bacterium]